MAPVACCASIFTTLKQDTFQDCSIALPELSPDAHLNLSEKDAASSVQPASHLEARLHPLSRPQDLSNPAHKAGVCDQSSTEQHLIYLTKTLISLLNLRSYAHPFFKKHLSPTMSTDYGNHRISGMQAFLDNYRIMAEMSPAFHTLLINESAVVDEWQGVGQVLVSKDMSAYLGHGRRMAGAIMFVWQRRWEVWVCESGCIMSGTPEFLC